MQAWLASSLRRFYPASPAEPDSLTGLTAARGERVSFQAVFRNHETARPISARVDGPDFLEMRIRRVGYVPMPHRNTDTSAQFAEGSAYIPGYVPDPLWPDAATMAGPHETHAFWLTIRVPSDTRPGTYPITVTLTASDGDRACLSLPLVIHDAVLPARYGFPSTTWLYADALCDWYNVAPFSEPFWAILKPYLANLTAHGQDTVYVPLFTPPLDGLKRPTQLLAVRKEGDRYHFDWDLVRRWVQVAREQGISRWEWTHLFTQWGASQAIRVYEDHGESEKLLWPADTGATSDLYRQFLGQFLPAFERFLRAERLLEASFFHLSDEPHGDEQLAHYRAARELLRQLAPWMRVMDAVSDVRFAREGLTDIPIPLLTTAPEFVAEGFSAWVYFCCGPRGAYLNRTLDTPLATIRMTGWLAFTLQARGLLHWGYNYWYRRQTRVLIDPFAVSDGDSWPDWPYGDTFTVYPGLDGPIDSLRWEVFAESLQDYALLQAAWDHHSPALADIHSYADFPRTEAWIALRRNALLARVAAIQSGNP
jgi:Domain of unknown function (DUF4091)